MKKRMLSICLAVIMLIGSIFCCPFSVSALENDTVKEDYIVNATGLRLRSTASTSGNELAIIPGGTVLDIAEIKDGWARTEYDGKSGWVMASFIAKKLTYTEMLSRLNDLRKKFPEGKYWNHAGSAEANLDGWTETPCGDHSVSTQYCNGQCDGFARKLGLDLFGYSPSYWKRTDNSLANLCIGDIIRYRDRHTVMVTGFTSDKDVILVADCNWNRNCNIDWDREFDLSRYITSYENANYYVLHVPYNNMNAEYLSGSSAGDKNPSDTDVSDSDVSGSDVSGSDVSGSDVSGSDISDSDVSGSDISDSDVSGSDAAQFALVEGNVSVLCGDTWKLNLKNTVKVSDSDAVAEWKSSDEKVVTVDGSGKVTAVGPGDAKVTVSLASYSDVCDFHVQGVGIVRLGGEDRIETANKIAIQGWGATGAENVILANGRNFPDALAGVPLAAALDAPILLTENKDVFDAQVLALMKTLGAKNVYILGGTAAVNSDIEKQITEAGYSVSRIAGETRYETALEIAKKLISITDKKPTEIFFACSDNYPDALSISSVAAIKGSPILYVASEGELDKLTSTYASALDCDNAVILGGEEAVSEDGEKSIAKCGFADVKRIYGNDRYKTSLAVVTEYKALFTSDAAAFATGLDFPDALAGGALAAKLKMPVVLTDNRSTLVELGETLRAMDLEKVYAYGGTAVVSDAVIYSYFQRWTY